MEHLFHPSLELPALQQALELYQGLMILELLMALSGASSHIWEVIHVISIGGALEMITLLA